MKMLNGLGSTFGAIALMALAAADTQAAVLYQDDFDGSSATDLTATAPTSNTGSILGADHGTTADNWSGASDWNADGSRSGGNIRSAVLNFDPVDGYIYTLTATAVTSGTGSDWSGIGFFETAAPGNVGITDNGTIWMLNRPQWSGGTSWQVAKFNDDGSSPNNTVYADNFGTSVSDTTYSIVLDTRDGTGLWDVVWQLGGSTFHTETDIGTTTADLIQGVGISGANDKADFSAFELTVEVPEPASLALLGLGGLMMVRRR